MIAKRTLAIAVDDTSGTLHEKLSRLGAELLGEHLERAGRGEPIGAEPQDGSLATASPMLDKEEGRVDWSLPAARVRDLLRAVDPWPGAFTTLAGEPLKLWRPKLASGGGAPGEVLGADRDGLIVACGEGALAIAELQLPGRKRMAAQALLAGRPIPPGTRLGAVEK
jgi:methionyl-tRNA formyltransferase